MKSIALTGTDQVAMVDDEDYPVLSRIMWHLSEHGYASHSRFYMHSLIMGFPEIGTLVIDHKDRNKLNNQKSNFRIATRQRNIMNQGKRKKPATSQYKGVCRPERRFKLRKPWQASITKTVDGIKKTHHLGYFATEEQAAIAYDKASVKLFGEFAWPNFR